MKKLIVISILLMIVVYNYTSKIETDNMNVTIEQTRQCAVDVQNGMPVEFCD